MRSYSSGWIWCHGFNLFTSALVLSLDFSSSDFRHESFWTNTCAIIWDPDCFLIFVLFLFHIYFGFLLYFLIFMVNFTYNGGTDFFLTPPLFSKVVCRFFSVSGGGGGWGAWSTSYLFSIFKNHTESVIRDNAKSETYWSATFLFLQININFILLDIPDIYPYQ